MPLVYYVRMCAHCMARLRKNAVYKIIHIIIISVPDVRLGEHAPAHLINILMAWVCK